MRTGSRKVQLSPEVLRWARERARFSTEGLATKIGVVEHTIKRWEATGELSLSQVRNLAKKTHTPIGLLYLSHPPEETLPIEDFRVIADSESTQPSPDLLDVIYAMQRRQDWMRDELEEIGADSLSFVGSMNTSTSPADAADSMRSTFGLSRLWASEMKSWSEAGRFLRRTLESASILVVVNGVVGNNTHRKLDPSEFRGFALVDEYAPLVFVNGADAQTAQIFTMIHECAHIWLGVSAVSNFDRLSAHNHKIEQWCNAVAGEFLVPEEEFRELWADAFTERPIAEAARQFRVSELVIARRALDFQFISLKTYREVQEKAISQETRASGGGNFWFTQRARIGSKFGDAVINAVREGRLLYRDAYELTDLRAETFDRYLEEMGF